MNDLVSVGSYSLNRHCPDFGKVSVGNVIRYSNSATQRWFPLSPAIVVGLMLAIQHNLGHTNT